MREKKWCHRNLYAETLGNVLGMKGCHMDNNVMNIQRSKFKETPKIIVEKRGGLNAFPTRHSLYGLHVLVCMLGSFCRGTDIGPADRLLPPDGTQTLTKCETSEQLVRKDEEWSQWPPPVKPFLVWGFCHCCPSSSRAVNLFGNKVAETY